MSPPAASGSILGRFPRHLEADQPGKLIGAVVDALASELEVASNEIGRVRRSRRLAEAAESVDLMLLAGLHGIEGHAVELLRQRLDAVAKIAGDSSLDDTTAQQAFARLPDALGLPSNTFGRWTGETTDAGARARLVAAIAPLVANISLLRLLRSVIETVIALHRGGNGTVRALLGGAANALQLDIQELRHSDDRFWHRARCRDRLRITRPGTPGTTEPPSVALVPVDDSIVLEENPLTDQTFGPVALRHGGQVTVGARVFEASPVTIRVAAIDSRTMAPMVVNLDTGVGLAFTGSLVAPQELVYANQGTKTTATVAGTDVGPQCFSFQGGVFADALNPYVKDFVFADARGNAPGRDNVATFAQTNPPGAFEQDHPLPVRTADLPPVVMPPGAARWALFVAVGTFGADGNAGPPLLADPLLLAARFDWSVFDPETAPPDPQPVGRLAFAWRAHQPFAAVVWIPKRFAALDDPGGPPAVANRVAKLLERHRAAGVRVDVRYVDNALALRMPKELA